jgi:hypothetical protein
MNAHPCTVCGEGGHPSRRCPTLSSPLTPGFYAPPAGHRPSGDEDDSSIVNRALSTTTTWGSGDDDESCKIERVIYMPPRISPPHVYVYSTLSSRRYR